MKEREEKACKGFTWSWCQFGIHPLERATSSMNQIKITIVKSLLLPLSRSRIIHIKPKPFALVFTQILVPQSLCFSLFPKNRYNNKKKRIAPASLRTSKDKEVKNKNRMSKCIKSESIPIDEKMDPFKNTYMNQVPKMSGIHPYKTVHLGNRFPYCLNQFPW